MSKKILIAIVILVIVIATIAGEYYLIQTQQKHNGGQDWWNDSWSYRKKLTFDNSGQSEALINFPILINLTPSNFDYLKAKSDGMDLRFIDDDGSTELKYHIEYWDPSGFSYIWVNVRKIDASSPTDFIWMYYGNSEASDVQDESGTYDANYMMVQHLRETSGTRYDSTSNNNDGTPYGGMYKSTSGMMDGSSEFDGSDGYIDYGNDNSLNIGDAITFEACIKLSSLKSGIISSKPGAYYLEINYDYKLVGAIYDTSNWYRVIGNTKLSINKWYHVVFTFNGENLRLYLNGDLEGESIHTGSIHPFLINNFYVGNQIFIDDFSYYYEDSSGTPTYEFENYGIRPNQRVENGAYHFSGSTFDEPIAIITGFNASDYVVETRVKTTSLTGGAYICPRFLTVENKYEIVLDLNWSKVFLNKVVNNVWTKIESVPLGWTVQNNTWYTLKGQITTEGNSNRIKIWVNDILYINQIDGDLMFYTKLAILAFDWNDPFDIHFDDVKVYIPFKGAIDEVRISNIERSPNWIKVQYISMNNGFITYGNEET